MTASACKRPLRLESVCHEANVVGESPVWSADDQALYWVDTRAGKVHNLDAEYRHTSWEFGSRVGAVGLSACGGLVATRAETVDLLTLSTQPASTKAEILVRPSLGKAVRLKEGKVDFQGRYWFASVGATPQARGGSLYRLDAERGVVEIDSGFMNPNGIAFSPDGKTMMMADTQDDRIFKYDLDVSSGDIKSRTEFFSTAGFPGVVDGATFDADGCLWFAFFDDWCVARLDPHGRLDRIVRLPVRHPTMCAFGGANLDILFVTSATAFLTEEDRAEQRQAGNLLAIHSLGSQGVPEPKFVR